MVVVNHTLSWGLLFVGKDKRDRMATGSPGLGSLRADRDTHRPCSTDRWRVPLGSVCSANRGDVDRSVAAMGRPERWASVVQRARRGRAKGIALVLSGAILLGLGGVGGAKAFQNFQGDQETAKSCSLIHETEALYSKQRQEAAGLSPEIAVLGDSYTEGLYISSPLKAFPYVLGEHLNKHVSVYGVGGTGYVAGGPCQGQQLSTRLDDALASRPRTLIVQAGINDRGKAGVRQAAEALLDEAKQRSPETKVVVIGPFSPAIAAGPELDAVANDLRAAAAATGSTYVDPKGWRYSLTDDRLHPSDSGHAVIGVELAKALAPLLG